MNDESQHNEQEYVQMNAVYVQMDAVYVQMDAV